MRTTLALLAVCDSEARWAHVGDSRVYWFRDGVLMQRTRDHSVAELVTGLRGSSLAAPSDDADRHRLVRVVGAGEGCRAEFGSQVVALRPGDAFLLCTDGVWSIVPDVEIATCLSSARSPRDWAGAVERRLRERLGFKMPRGQDNYSMICGMVAPP
jgi:serine/threonine protein phosphatase PrpC